MLPTLCVLAIFKNERASLAEWISHYRHFGVNHFLLGDNASDDDSRDIVLAQKLIRDDIDLIDMPMRHRQVYYYNSMIESMRRFEFCLVVDIDEYVYPRGNFSSLPAYLAALRPDVSQVLVNWKMFGSSGFIEQPEFIRISFVDREPSVWPETKSIVRTRRVQRMEVHSHQVLGSTIRENNLLHLNHYPIMSLQHFRRVKMTRGAVATMNSENVRTMAYFHRYDQNKTVVDRELADIITRQ